MIFELRIYTCRPGTVSTVLEMWQQQGQPMIEPYMKMVGQWTSESGTANQIYTLWAFADLMNLYNFPWKSTSISQLNSFKISHLN